MGDLSVEIFSSATGVTKIDVFHPDPIEQLWHGSRVLDYFYHIQWDIESDQPRYIKQYASMLSYGLSPAIGRGPLGVRDIALVLWSSGEISEGSRTPRLFNYQ